MLALGCLEMSATEIEKAVEQLPPDELAAFANWFEEYLGDRWDQQIERDIAAGKLDHLGEKADEDFESVHPPCGALCVARLLVMLGRIWGESRNDGLSLRVFSAVNHQLGQGRSQVLAHA